MHYLFELGRQPEISRAEIESVFASLEIEIQEKKQENSLFFVQTTKPLDTQMFMERLGGTIKISQEVKTIQNQIEDIASYLEQIKSVGKIEFSLHGNDGKNIALDVKKYLKAQGRSVRYIEPKNTATILHNNLVEHKTDLTIKNKILFATQAIQPIEEWGERDFERPGRDSKSGMIPPKLARILLNLSQIDTKNKATLLDPFCGSGTILCEAYLLKVPHILGSDASQKAVNDSKKNIEWIQNLNPAEGKTSTVKIFVSDATRVANTIEKESIDAIVSEPYLGKPMNGRETKFTLLQQAKELHSLYVQSFQSFSKIVKKGGTVVFIIPKFLVQKEWVSVNCISEIEKFGFSVEPLTSTKDSLFYHRPTQFVGREIWKFRK